MSAHLFTTETHTVRASHIREYPNATSPSLPQETPLYICAKQYIPIQQPSSSLTTASLPNIRNPPTAITILTAPALGIPSECYLPLFDALLQQSLPTSANPTPAYTIRSIWTVDPTHEGASSVLNAPSLSTDSNWFDHSRDLLHLINTHPTAFPRPILGLGHSRGCAQLVALSLLHPRLLAGLIMLEPLMLDAPPPGRHASYHATNRRDIWPSRAAAAAEWKKSRMYKAWDPAVLEQYIQHGLRPTPTFLHPTAPPGSVTLTTTKHQEAWAFTRAVLHPLHAHDPKLERLLGPDVTAEVGRYISHAPQSVIVLKSLPHVRPSVFYAFGVKSPMAPPAAVEDKLARTGAGVGGSGGREGGKVEAVVLEGTGHNAPLEKPGVCAEVVAGWVGRWVEGWEREEDVLRGLGKEASEGGEGKVVSEQWKKMVAGDAWALRPGAGVGKEKL